VVKCVILSNRGGDILSLIQHIDLINGISLNPIPMEVGQQETVTKWLMGIQSKVNSIIDMGNAWESNANKYTDASAKIIQAEYDALMVLINNGNIIPNGSIDMDKLNTSFLSDLQDIILQYVHNSSKFISFGLDDNGYFVAYIPETWDEITFSTSVDGELCLTIN
jgi:hypothetical protein